MRKRYISDTVRGRSAAKCRGNNETVKFVFATFSEPSVWSEISTTNTQHRPFTFVLMNGYFQLREFSFHMD